MFNNNRVKEQFDIIHDFLTPIWEKGRYTGTLDGSGGHWVYPGLERPVSISAFEGAFLYNLVKSLKPKNSFEIGTAFGYSLFWVASAMSEQDEKWLGSIDNLSEGGLKCLGQAFAKKNLVQLHAADYTELFIGESPQDLPKILENRKLDFLFIDGGHRNNQPDNDYQGIKPFLCDNSVIVWHDVHESYGTPYAIQQCISDGFELIELNTSCKMCVTYKDIRHKTLIDIALKNTIKSVA